MAIWRRVGAAVYGTVVAGAPAVSLARQQGSRALSPGADMWTVVLLTLLAVGAILLVATLGYLYRRERGLEWDFQRPDANDHAQDRH